MLGREQDGPQKGLAGDPKLGILEENIHAANWVQKQPRADGPGAGPGRESMVQAVNR